MILLEKQCKGCYQTKPVTAFNKAGGAKDGLHHYCIPCHRLRHKALNLAALEAGYTRRTWIKGVSNKIRKPLIDRKFLELLGRALIEVKPDPVIDPILERIRAQYKQERSLLYNKQMTMEEGFVYCISNPKWPGMYKVGSALDYEKRLNTYQTYDPHRGYKLEHKLYVSKRLNAEKDVLDNLQSWLVSGEWFNVGIDTIINSINTIGAKYGN